MQQADATSTCNEQMRRGLVTPTHIGPLLKPHLRVTFVHTTDDTYILLIYTCTNPSLIVTVEGGTLAHSVPRTLCILF